MEIEAEQSAQRGFAAEPGSQWVAGLDATCGVRTICNPILPGFNPDPSIVRVGDDYYIANSTFEWFPGVRIHHSRDLVNWRLLACPLDRVELLDMKGVPNSGGIWAPCLTWADGLFWLCFTVVRELNSATKDSPNYLVTAPSVTGPWSDPVYLNSSGFDPSLFHDEDGRKWLVNMVWDHRPGRNPFYGIELQEYCPVHRRLVGEPVNIFRGTELGCTEGPHLYRRNGYYYLMTAEGGTGLKHAVTLARSRHLDGPYRVHPSNPVLTSWKKDHLALQKAGHADLVETQDGEWYMVHLCSRPLPENGRCILGRETAIQRVEWREDDWLYLSGGGNDPSLMVPAPGLAPHPFEKEPARDDFDAPDLGMRYQTLRRPLDKSCLSLEARPGWLRLAGGESLESKFSQSLVARRQQAFRCRATTLLEFQPDSFQQMAGLVCYYSTRMFHYFCMSVDEDRGNCLYILSANEGKTEYPLGTDVIPLGDVSRVYLRAELDHHLLRFFHRAEGGCWTPAGAELDASILSDDHGEEWGFTGTFLGLACQDLSGRRKHADFDYFEYLESPDVETEGGN
jgi:xylan 1,4-beta-xylosidase